MQLFIKKDRITPKEHEFIGKDSLARSVQTFLYLSSGRGSRALAWQRLPFPFVNHLLGFFFCLVSFSLPLLAGSNGRIQELLSCGRNHWASLNQVKLQPSLALRNG